MIFLQDNSRKEWAFHKAVTIQTYSNYHPIPVPFNIISTLVMCICGFCTKRRDDDVDAVARREQHERVGRLYGEKDISEMVGATSCRVCTKIVLTSIL